MPSPWNLFGSILFSIIGLAAFIYGKKSGSIKPIIIGVLLMVYLYFIRGTALLYLLGASLTASLFIFH